VLKGKTTINKQKQAYQASKICANVEVKMRMAAACSKNMARHIAGIMGGRCEVKESES